MLNSVNVCEYNGYLNNFADMKHKLKHIAVAVIVVMACLFTYQSWWLVRMYRSEVTTTENAVRTALRTSDFSEKMARRQKARYER